jgi:hypothetical protein
MTILNSKFDIIGRDPHQNARAGLLVVLPVNSPPAVQSDGTPTAGSIVAGTIVAMNTSGKAVVADNAAGAKLGGYPTLLFTAIDGDADFDGAFVHRVTCIQGGAEFQLGLTANVVGTTGFVVGTPLTVSTGADVGKWMVAAAGGTKQIYGFVGQDGIDTAKGILNVIVPQGLSPAMP